MAIHLRQICLVAEALAPAVDDLARGLGLSPCYVDPHVAEFGLENTLLRAGSQFLEVVAPTGPGTAAGRQLARRGGDGGYMVICQADTRAEQTALRARAADLGVRVAFEVDRGTWNIMQLHPGDMGAAFLEVDWDEAADPTGNWHPTGGLDWQRAPAGNAIIAAATLQHPDPGALAARWAAVLGLPVTDRGDIHTIALANADLHFMPDTDGRGAGLGGITLSGATKNLPATLCGTRFTARP
jgi:hypothetical protein